MTYTYDTTGTCARKITFDMDENGCVRNVQFLGGCNGNLKGISALIQGMNAQEIIAKLKGINCNGKGTSCPDQLARALEKIQEQK